MSPRKTARQPVPTFLDDCPEWREFTGTETDLFDRQRAAQDRQRDNEQQHREARAAYDAAVSAAARGEADAPSGERPMLDPVPGMVAHRARERVSAHRAKRVALLADLADRVESAAREWWTAEAPTVTEHVRQITDDAERLSEVLAQVREVRAAFDRQHSAQPAARLADRTARVVDAATLTRLGDADPLALAPVELPQGRIQRVTTPRERLGVQRFEHPGPDGREPGPPALPDRDPVRDFL